MRDTALVLCVFWGVFGGILAVEGNVAGVGFLTGNFEVWNLAVKRKASRGGKGDGLYAFGSLKKGFEVEEEVVGDTVEVEGE